MRFNMGYATDLGRVVVWLELVAMDMVRPLTFELARLGVQLGVDSVPNKYR